MSRGGIERETFVKGQLEAVHKAVTKAEMPLKPKHARRLIVGTHQEKSSGVFWNAVNRIQLEKHPVLTWKFCHLLHKLLRDGHRKYPVMPGNLTLSESQIKTLESDLDNAFEMTISLLDEMDNLLTLQQKAFDTIECLRLSSLVPQGQCLLAPLIIVILDTSKFYDHLVKMIFKLHSQVPPDALEGHRSRFRDVFKKTKDFYERCSALQYFKYLVSIPTLPGAPPNFLQAADLESYRPPQAYLREESEGDDQSMSVAEDALLDLANVEFEAPQQHSPPQVDQRDETITVLQRSLEEERFKKERLLQEARSRIEQYENRLTQMQGEYEHARREADDYKEEKERYSLQLASRDALRSESNDSLVKEANEKARLSEEKLSKFKSVYEKFRADHLNALTKLGDLQKQFEASGKTNMDKDEEIIRLNRQLEELDKERNHFSSRAASDAAAVDEVRTQLAKADIEMEELRKQLEHINATHKSELVQSSDRWMDEKSSIEKQFNESLKESISAIFDRCEEDLPNATSISYPPHLAQSALGVVTVLTENNLTGPKEIIIAAHFLPSTLLACASAAYTSSIQHFEDVNEQCKRVITVAKDSFGKIPVTSDNLHRELEILSSLIASLPVNSDVDKEAVGNEVELEMRRMDEAIRQAVDQIEAIQRKARENSDGVRFKVNEAILACCQSLMNAIMRLVSSSRELQTEIVAAGRGGVSPTDFYKRNHQWTEGLLSAAKAVGVAARVLVAAADGVVTGQGKFEQLIVAAQEIAASTAQLFVSSRVKADKDSKKFSDLSGASREVNQCTAQVVASVKSGQTTLNEKDVLDFSHLSLHEAKKEEMESQVRMLELEQALNVERARLRELRKQHYHMAQLVANKDDKDSSFEFLG